MSTKRELDEAKMAVINAAIAWASHDPYFDEGGFERLGAIEAELEAAASALRPLLVDLDGDAAANATYTSIAAAKSLPRGGLRRQVLRSVFWAGRGYSAGLTTDQIEMRLGRQHTSVSSAVNYLVNHGLLEKAGTRQKTRQGRWAEMYRCTELAVRLINEDAARAAMA